MLPFIYLVMGYRVAMLSILTSIISMMLGMGFCSSYSGGQAGTDASLDRQRLAGGSIFKAVSF